MKKLFYVRHGQTVMNVQGLLAGQIETPLTDEGREQAEVAGAVLASEYPKIDLIVSSLLSRAYDTAKLIADQIDYPHEKILTNTLLAERSFGVREGTVFTFEGPFNTSKEYRALDKVKNAETFEQVHQRAAKALDYLRSLPEDNILVVSHSGFGRALRPVVQERPYMHDYTHHDTRIGNAEIVELI
jgi:broad specificity phosphatase PhoE